MRPGLLTNGPATDRYRILTASKDWQFGMISRADVADFLVRQVNDRSLLGTTHYVRIRGSPKAEPYRRAVHRFRARSRNGKHVKLVGLRD